MTPTIPAAVSIGFAVAASLTWHRALEKPWQRASTTRVAWLLRVWLMAEDAKEAPAQEPPIADAVKEAMSGMAATLEEAQASVLESLQKMKKEAADSMYNDAVGFYHAVDWSQSWLRALAAFHAVMWLACLLTRRSYEAQMVLLVVIRTPPAACESARPVCALTIRLLS